MDATIVKKRGPAPVSTPAALPKPVALSLYGEASGCNLCSSYPHLDLEFAGLVRLAWDSACDGCVLGPVRRGRWMAPNQLNRVEASSGSSRIHMASVRSCMIESGFLQIKKGERQAFLIIFVFIVFLKQIAAVKMG